MASKPIFVLFVAVFVYQCSGQDKYDAIVATGVEYSPPSAPLFVISAVPQGMSLHLDLCLAPSIAEEGAVPQTVCVCVCVYLCVCVYIFQVTSGCVYSCVCVHPYVCTFVYVYLYMLVFMAYVCVRVNRCVYVHVIVCSCLATRFFISNLEGGAVGGSS